MKVYESFLFTQLVQIYFVVAYPKFQADCFEGLLIASKVSYLILSIVDFLKVVIQVRQSKLIDR